MVEKEPVMMTVRMLMTGTQFIRRGSVTTLNQDIKLYHLILHTLPPSHKRYIRKRKKKNTAKKRKINNFLMTTFCKSQSKMFSIRNSLLQKHFLENFLDKFAHNLQCNYEYTPFILLDRSLYSF